MPIKNFDSSCWEKYPPANVSTLLWSDLLNICCDLGAESIKRCHLTSIGNPIVEIRRSYDRLISTMGFPMLIRCHLHIESGPWPITPLTVLDDHSFFQQYTALCFVHSDGETDSTGKQATSKEAPPGDDPIEMQPLQNDEKGNTAE